MKALLAGLLLAATLISSASLWAGSCCSLGGSDKEETTKVSADAQ